MSPVSQAISSRLELTSTEYFFIFIYFLTTKKFTKKKEKKNEAGSSPIK